MRRGVVLVCIVALVVTPAAARSAPGISRSLRDRVALSALDAVSCAAKHRCVAVGYFERKVDSTDLPLAESWNGSRWSPMSLPPVSGSFALTGVACPTRSFCMAVGSDEDLNDVYGDDQGPSALSLAESWNGATWRVVPLAKAPHNVLLDGVSCASASYCIAVGNQFRFAQQIIPNPAIAEYWDGKHWRVTSVPKAEWSALTAVSCASNGTCLAVGSRDPLPYSLLSYQRPFAVRWQEGRWHPVSLPAVYNVQDRSYYTLAAASCPSTHFCRLVGYWQDRMAQLSLAEGLNGKKWSLIGIPGGSVVAHQDPFDGPFQLGSTTLAGVSCASRAQCLVVGNFLVLGNPRQVCGGHDNGLDCPFAVSWNGKLWSLLSAPQQRPSIFVAVSCASVTSCMVVGTYGDAAGPLLPPLQGTALAEQWNGARWQRIAVALPDV